MKTLVIGLNWVGDVIMSFPAISTLAKAAHQSVDILTRPHLKTLYDYHPEVGTCYDIDTRKPFWHLLPLAKMIRKKKYEKVIILPQSFRSAWVSFLFGGLDRIGFAATGRNYLLHHAIKLPDNFEKIHESLLYLMLCGIPILDMQLPELPRFSRPTVQLDKFGLAGKSYAVLAPGAAFGAAKRWSPDRFRTLAHELSLRDNLKIVVTGTAGEKEIATLVSAGAHLNLAGQTTLPELLTLLSGASVLVANDSGTMHLGAFARTPLVVPVGPTDMLRTGPLTQNVRFVSANNCQPCRKKLCPRKDHRCMRDIQVSKVLAEVEYFLDHASKSVT